MCCTTGTTAIIRGESAEAQALGLRLKTEHRGNRCRDAVYSERLAKISVYLTGGNGGALCLACPTIQTAIFRLAKAKTMSLLPSQIYLQLHRHEWTSCL
jgi:hypothetical protein